MKMHTTNYYNTFIEVAEDCPTATGEIPPLKAGQKTVANQQFELLQQNPYRFTSDEVFFQVFAERNDLTQEEHEPARQQFFSKGQPCFRASPLTKRYGWGVHSNEEGRIAIYGCETEAYARYANDPSLKVVKAMKSSR